ncbi:undecaprenyl-phosphate galactose phosphotransferase WbaP [Desulfurobacterium thermolithotrophum]
MYLKNLILIVFDIFSYYVCLVFAYLTRDFFGHSIFPPYQMELKHLLSFWWFPIVFILFIALEKLYTFRFPFWEEARRLTRALTIATVVIFAIVSLGKMSEEVSRLTLIFLWLYALFLFPSVRYIVKSLLYKIPKWREPVTLIGDTKLIEELEDVLENNKFIGYEVVKKILLRDRNSLLEDVSSKIDTQTVIISIPLSWIDDAERFLAKIQKTVRRILFVPNIRGLAFLNSELYPIPFSEIFFLSIKNNLKSKLNKTLKRAFDLLISLMLLPVLIPLILIIAILIKLDSKGPVFFVHERIGENGKTIRVIKFRTMYHDAKERLEKLLKEDEQARKEWETNFKLKNDPRVTKIGKLLRKTSLDELPQIFNVLKGDMSLVGPRPVVKEEIEKYYGDFAQYYYMVKPGITGLWQVSGRSDTDYDKRVRLDTWYVLNWSLWLDLVILIKTVEAVLKGKGAY